MILLDCMLLRVETELVPLLIYLLAQLPWLWLGLWVPPLEVGQIALEVEYPRVHPPYFRFPWWFLCFVSQIFQVLIDQRLLCIHGHKFFRWTSMTRFSILWRCGSSLPFWKGLGSVFVLHFSISWKHYSEVWRQVLLLCFADWIMWKRLVQGSNVQLLRYLLLQFGFEVGLRYYSVLDSGKYYFIFKNFYFIFCALVD